MPSRKENLIVYYFADSRVQFPLSSGPLRTSWGALAPPEEWHLQLLPWREGGGRKAPCRPPAQEQGPWHAPGAHSNGCTLGKGRPAPHLWRHRALPMAGPFQQAEGSCEAQGVCTAAAAAAAWSPGRLAPAAGSEQPGTTAVSVLTVHVAFSCLEQKARSIHPLKQPGGRGFQSLVTSKFFGLITEWGWAVGKAGPLQSPLCVTGGRFF